MRYAIIQHDMSGEAPLTEGRYGTLAPVNFDGFYADRGEAHEVARFMAEQRPDLQTLVVEVLDEVKG